MPSRTWVPPAPYDLARTLRVLRRGRGDPACRQEPDGTWWKCSRTPYGPVTLRISDHLDPVGGRPDHRHGVGPGRRLCGVEGELVDGVLGG
ncbi:hypothetical protein JHN58_11750, partial [Streptomyces sp. MBT55]|nr:hypothetical protein [Streptomyces sp. MBT55]